MEDRRAVGVAAASLYNSYEFYFGPRKENAMRYDFSDDPYYQTAREEKAEMRRLEALQDEAREALWREREDARVDAEDRPSQCDCCAAMKYDCVDLVIMGMDTHACPECRNDSPENF